MQSKFWGDNSEGFYSDSSEYSNNADEKEVSKRKNATPTWAVSDSSSDDGEARIVKSAKAKSIEAIQSHMKTIDHHKKINDFSELLKDYDALSRLIDKQYSSSRLPKLVVKIIVDLTQFMEKQQKDKESCKKFSKTKSIAFNTLRSRLRKFNEQYSEVLEEYSADPDNFFDILEESGKECSDLSFEEEEEDDDDDDDVDDDDGNDNDNYYYYCSGSDSAKEGHGKPESSIGGKSSESDKFSDWSGSGTSSISEEDTPDKHRSALAKWGVKKSVEQQAPASKVKVAAKKPKVKVIKKKDDKERQFSDAATGALVSVVSVYETLLPALAKMEPPDDDNPFGVLKPELEELLGSVHLSAESIKLFVKSVVEKRGKKGANSMENMRILQILPHITKKISHSLYIDVVETLIHIKFDAYSNAYGAMTPKQWIETYRIVAHLVSELIENPESVLSSHNMNAVSYTSGELRYEREPVLSNSADEDDDDDDYYGYGGDDGGEKRLKKSMTILSSVIQKLNDELYKGLLHIDVDNDDYKTMLVYTVDILYLLHKTLLYYLDNGSECYKQAATTALIILDHVHYKDDFVASKIWDLVRQKVKEQRQLERFFPNEEKKPSEIVSELVYFVFDHGTYREKIRACLHLAYNKSLHGLYYEARDLLLTPSLQELTSEADVSTQIFLNRNLAQLGICAFRMGLINEAHSYFADLCSQNRHKELLAQGLSITKNQEKPVEQERAEKRRLLPYHMHLSIELIESVNNICALLLETANFARSSLNNREIISRQFRRMFEIHEKQVFIGPPENNREVILTAFKYLQNGNWSECFNHLSSLNTWNSMPRKEEVQAILKERIKIEAFRTYIFKYVSIYDSFSVQQLSSMFYLDANVIHSLISKMIVTGEIHASWDDNSKCCLINHTEPTDLQKLAIKLSENLTTAVEQNELTLNMKNPKFALSQDRRFQQRDTKYSYNTRRDDRHNAALNFSRSRKTVQPSRQNKHTAIPTR